MGRIFYLMGKSASGKDTLFKVLLRRFPQMRTVTMYTTRPVREHERDGQEYYFVTRQRRRELEAEGKVVECRTYQTVDGPWDYFTVDDGQIDLERYDYLMLGTLESYEKIRKYYGEDVLYPLYVEVEDSLRLERAIGREREQIVPNYREVCRRYLADEEDFCEEKLTRLGIDRRYVNDELTVCVGKIERDIQAQMIKG